MRRHAHVVARVLAGLLLVIAVAYFLLTRTDSDSVATRGEPRVSIANLKIDQFTTSRTADGAAIAPDGKHVVYVEHGGGSDSLRLRDLGTGTDIEILAAQNGVQLAGLTVAPDGAFVTCLKVVPPQRVELWQVPISGGPPRQLLEANGGRVGFSPDRKRMAYTRRAGSDRTEVVIAAIDGSNATVAAARRMPEAFLTTSIDELLSTPAPAWSPDGKTLAVLGTRLAAPGGGREDTGQVVFVDVQTGSERTVNAGPPLIGSGLEWLDERWLVVSMYERPGAPMQLWLLSYEEGEFHRLSNDLNQYIGLSLTADRDALVTSRVELSSGIWTNDASARWTQVVPDTPVTGAGGFGVEWIGDDLLYVASTMRGLALMRWSDSTRKTELFANSAANPSVSRDGSTIAFLDHDSGEAFTMDASSRNRERVYRWGGAGRLTPNGQQLLRIGAGPKGPVVQLYSVDGSGNVREMMAERVALGRAEASPDGRRLAYSSRDERDQPAIAVCELADCSSRTPLSPIQGKWRWTPDSLALAYVDPRTQSDIWIQPLDGSTPRQLTRFASDGRTIMDFAWSADGKRLAVARAVSSTNIVLLRGLRRGE